MPRANVALREGFPASRSDRLAGARTASGQVPLPPLEPHYFPSKGAHFATRQILRHPQAILRAYRLVGEWLAAADPRTDPGFGFLAAFWDALNDHITAHGDMHLFLRHNHI